MTAAQAAAYWRNQAWQFICAHPLNFLRLVGIKLGLLVSAYEIPNNENYQYLRQQSVLLACLPGSGLLVPLGLVGLSVAWPQRRRLAPLYVFCGTQTAALLLTIVTDRYRFPLTLVLFPYAAYLVVHLLTLVQEQRWRRVIGISSAVLCLGVVSWASLGVPTARQQRDLQNATIKMRVCAEEQRLWTEIATHSAIPGVRMHRQSAALWVRLAQLRVSLKDHEGAVELLRHATTLYPEQPPLWLMLGHTLAELGDTTAAEEALGTTYHLPQEQ